MERPDLAARVDLATVEGRRTAEVELEDAVAAWTAGRSAEDAERVLQAAGVPAHLAASSADFVGDPQLRTAATSSSCRTRCTAPRPSRARATCCPRHQVGRRRGADARAGQRDGAARHPRLPDANDRARSGGGGAAMTNGRGLEGGLAAGDRRGRPGLPRRRGHLGRRPGRARRHPPLPRADGAGLRHCTPTPDAARAAGFADVTMPYTGRRRVDAAGRLACRGRRCSTARTGTRNPCTARSTTTDLAWGRRTTGFFGTDIEVDFLRAVVARGADRPARAGRSVAARRSRPRSAEARS